MRTPLNTVIGFADMLSQNLFGDLNSRQAEYAKGILNTSQTLVSLLEDVLDLPQHQLVDQREVDALGKLLRQHVRVVLQTFDMEE